MSPEKSLINLVEARENVLWLIKVRQAPLWDKLSLEEQKCPMSRDRIMVTYFHYSDENLQEELLDLSERINLSLEKINISQIADLL